MQVISSSSFVARALLLAVCVAPQAQAALNGRLPATPGGVDYQAYYDDVLDITWLQNGNLAGSMTWDDANAWAGSLVFAGLNGWRLPSMDRNNDDVVVNCASVSEADCRDNELAYLYFYYGVDSLNPGPFSNIDFIHTWSGTEFAANAGFAWFFVFTAGVQDRFAKGNIYGAWAVRSGDVGAGLTTVDGLNIDFGDLRGTPTGGGAAGQDGTWNTIAPAMSGSHSQSLLDLAGQPSAAFIDITGSASHSWVGASTGSDVTDDFFFTPDPWDITISGLDAGTYDVFYYGSGSGAVATGAIDVEGAAGTDILDRGNDTVTDVVVTDGTLSISSGPSALSLTGLGGLQVVRTGGLPPPGVTRIVDANGILFGATNVSIGAELYDVAFVDGTCDELFDGCDPGLFAVSGDTTAAGNALLNQVFLDTPDGPFDTAPDLTNGCTATTSCGVWIPEDYQPGSNVITLQIATNGSAEQSDVLSPPSLSAFVADDLSEEDQFVYAVWCLAGTGCAPEVDPPGAEDGIVGAWYFFEQPDAGAGGPVFLNFLDTGQFLFGQDGDPANDPNGEDGMEWGTYTFDGATLSFNTMLDTNGEWGPGSETLPAVVDGNTLTVAGELVLQRVASASLVGGWLADGPVDDESVSITFRDDGTFMLLHGNNPGDTCGCGQAGIEYGTYTWDEMTGAISFGVITDTNGEFGISNPVGGSWSLILNGDQFILDDGDVAPVFNRIQPGDDDDDGVFNSADNCVQAANPDQADADSDGFGNACDADLNNDCNIDFQDLSTLKALFFGTDPLADFDLSGSVDFGDLAIMKSSFFSAPGPSSVPNICNTPFTGALLDNLRIWLDAADTGTVTADGGTVWSWADKGRATRVVAAPGEDQRPANNVSAQNGLPTLFFDGNDDLLCGSDDVNLTGELSIFVVGRNALRQNYNGMVSQRNSTAENALLEFYWQVGVSDSTSGNLVYAVNRDVELGVVQRFDAPPPVANPYLAAILIGNDNSQEMRINLQAQSPGLPASPNLLPAAAAPLCVGLGFGATPVGNILNGELAEVLVFDRKLDAGEIALIETYLNDKWAVVPN